MSFSQNLTVLSLLLAKDHEAMASYLEAAGGPPADFVHFVDDHCLDLSIVGWLEGSPLRCALAETALEQLTASAARQRLKQRVLLHELMRVCALLEAAGHEHILLKGPYLAERFCGGVDHRRFADLDILVRPEELRAVDGVLHGDGYSRRSNALVSHGLATRYTHAFDFTKGGVTLDLHWKLSAHAALPLDHRAVWQQRGCYVLHERTVSVLSDEHELVFSLLSLFKDVERGAARLKSFVDLCYILDGVGASLDWEAFFRNRSQEKSLRISVTILVWLLELFDCRDRFPTLAATLARNTAEGAAVSRSTQRTLLEATPGAWSNKRWAAGLYQCSRARVWRWWLVSLPFRLAAHRPASNAAIGARP